MLSPLSLLIIIKVFFSFYLPKIKFRILETAVYSVIVDPITGKLTNVSENIVYAGGSGTYDGISAFNSATGSKYNRFSSFGGFKVYFWIVYYYVTDFDVIDYVYSTNVVKAQVLAPLDVYAKAVFRLAANPNNGLAYILFYSSQGSKEYNIFCFV